MWDDKPSPEEQWLQQLHDFVYEAMDVLPLRKILDGLEAEAARIKRILED